MATPVSDRDANFTSFCFLTGDVTVIIKFFEHLLNKCYFAACDPSNRDKSFQGNPSKDAIASLLLTTSSWWKQDFNVGGTRDVSPIHPTTVSLKGMAAQSLADMLRPSAYHRQPFASIRQTSVRSPLTVDPEYFAFVQQTLESLYPPQRELIVKLLLYRVIVDGLSLFISSKPSPPKHALYLPTFFLRTVVSLFRRVGFFHSDLLEQLVTFCVNFNCRFRPQEILGSGYEMLKIGFITKTLPLLVDQKKIESEQLLAWDDITSYFAWCSGDLSGNLILANYTRALDPVSLLEWTTDPTVIWPIYPKPIPLTTPNDSVYHTNPQDLRMALCLKLQECPHFRILDFVMKLLKTHKQKQSLLESLCDAACICHRFKTKFIYSLYSHASNAFSYGYYFRHQNKVSLRRIFESGPLCNVCETTLAPLVLLVLAHFVQEHHLSSWHGRFKLYEHGEPRSLKGFGVSLACLCLSLFSRQCLATCLEFETHIDEYLESAAQLDRRDRFQAKYRSDMESFEPLIRKQIAVIKTAGDSLDLSVVADIFQRHASYNSSIQLSWKQQIYCSSIYMAMVMHVFGLHNAELWLLNHTICALEENDKLHSTQDLELKARLWTEILACQQRAEHLAIVEQRKLADQTFSAVIHHRNSVTSEPDQVATLMAETPLSKKATKWTYDDTIDGWVLMTPQEAAVRSRDKQDYQVHGQSSPLATSQQTRNHAQSWPTSGGQQQVYVEIPMLIEDDELRLNPARDDAFSSDSDGPDFNLGSSSGDRGKGLSFNILRSLRKTSHSRSFSQTVIGDSCSPLSNRRLFQRATTNAKARGRESLKEREEEEENDDLDLFRAKTPPPKRVSTRVQRFDVKQEELMRRSASGSKGGNRPPFRRTVEASAATTTAAARLQPDYRSMTRSNSFPLAFGEPHASMAGMFDLDRGDTLLSPILPTPPQAVAVQTHARARRNSRITVQRERRQRRQHGWTNPHHPSDADLNENNANQGHGADSDWIESEAEDLPTPEPTNQPSSKTYNLRSNPQRSTNQPSVAVDHTQSEEEEEEEQHETLTETTHTNSHNDHIRDTSDDGIAVVIELEACCQKRRRTIL